VLLPQCVVLLSCIGAYTASIPLPYPVIVTNFFWKPWRTVHSLPQATGLVFVLQPLNHLSFALVPSGTAPWAPVCPSLPFHALGSHLCVV
jgi:hypothetical protein